MAQKSLWMIVIVSTTLLFLTMAAVMAEEPPEYEEGIQKLRDLIADFSLSNMHDVVINEIELNSASHDTTSPDDWVEIYNRGRVDVDLSGWLILIRGVFKEGTDVEWDTVEIPSETYISPNGYVVIRSSGNWLKRATARLVLVARLPDETYLPVDVALASGDGRSDETPGYDSVFEDYADDNRTWQRVPDGGCDDWRFLPGTCEASNAATPRSTVVFSAVQYMPRLDGDQLNEYVEIINLSDTALDLAGWTLQDRDDAGQSYELPSCVLAPNTPFRIYTGSLPQGVDGIALGRQAALWNNNEPDYIELLHTNGWRMATTSYWTDWDLALIWNDIEWQPTSETE